MAQAIWRSPSSFAMHSARPSCYPNELYTVLWDVAWIKRTFVKTAIDAYEFPKLMPTILGTAETSIGAPAVPFGMIPFGAIVYGAFKRTRAMRAVWSKSVQTHGRKKSKACERTVWVIVLSDKLVVGDKQVADSDIDRSPTCTEYWSTSEPLWLLLLNVS